MWLEKHENADEVVDDIINNSAQLKEAVVSKNNSN